MKGLRLRLRLFNCLQTTPSKEMEGKYEREMNGNWTKGM